VTGESSPAAHAPQTARSEDGKDQGTNAERGKRRSKEVGGELAGAGHFREYARERAKGGEAGASGGEGTKDC
jgi:hypothetical protein